MVDEKDETLIISPVEKINFITSKQDNFKKLNIKGILFDLNFKSLWQKKYNSEMNSQIEIDFKEPNISIKNQLNYKDRPSLDGSILITFFNQNIEIDYIYENNKITLTSPNKANDIKINSSIELRPFYLNSNITLNQQNLNFMIDELIFSLFNLKPNLLGNLNGDIELLLTNVEHELIRNGKISFSISQNTINFDEVLLNIGDIGQMYSEIRYNEKDGDIIFSSSNSLLIKNKKAFAKKFQVKPDKVKDINMIYFKIDKNINTGLISIFDIKTNQEELKEKNNAKLRYNINNTQKLKSLVKKIINN